MAEGVEGKGDGGEFIQKGGLLAAGEHPRLKSVNEDGRVGIEYSFPVYLLPSRNRSGDFNADGKEHS